MYYTVHEVAKRLALSPYTIRYYAKEGLLPFVERDQNGNRLFKASDFEKLFIISSLKKAGMPIKQIRTFICLSEKGDSTISQRLQILKEQRTCVEEQITELQDALDILKYKCWLYEAAEAAGTSAVYDTMPPEKMPANIRRIKERIRRLSDDMEQRYKEAGKKDT